MSWCEPFIGTWRGVAGAGPKGSPGERSPNHPPSPPEIALNSDIVSFGGEGRGEGSSNGTVPPNNTGCHRLHRCIAITLACVLIDVNASAGEPERITRDGVRKLAPVFADSGETIYFSMHREPTRVALFRLRVADGTTEPVETTLTEHQFDPDVSADGRYLCFVLTAGSPQSVLVIRDRVEQKEARYTPREARGTVRNPKLDAKQGRVVFTVSDPGGQQIAAVGLDGQNFQLLTQSTGTNGWPAVSPDGGQIAFTSSRDGSLQLYVMSADGDDLQRLTEGPQRNMRAAWSPDGKQLAYVSSIDGDLELCVMRANGSEVRRITDRPGRDDFPAWHPDGRRLLFVSERDGDCDLYLTDVEPLQ